jgi:hypothetical protein
MDAHHMMLSTPTHDDHHSEPWEEVRTLHDSQAVGERVAHYCQHTGTRSVHMEKET